MGVYIKNWSLADWKELLKWAKIGANNAMIGEFAEVEELPPHGRLIDADALKISECHCCDGWCDFCECDCLNCKSDHRCSYIENLDAAPTIIEAEEGE